MKKFSGEVGIKCHQSCTVALVFCTKLYIKNIKLAVSLCSFSQFSFPFNFRTANVLVLKFGTLPLRCLFSNILLAIFDIFFRSKVIHHFVPKNVPKMTCGACFSTYLHFKSEFKKSRARFFSSQSLLAEETKRLSLARPVFNLKAIEFGSFFAYFHLFSHLKVIQPFQKYAKTFYFRQAFR